MTYISLRAAPPVFITVIVNETNSPTVTLALSATLIKAISGATTTVVLLEYAFKVALLVKLEPAITSAVNSLL